MSFLAGKDQSTVVLTMNRDTMSVTINGQPVSMVRVRFIKTDGTIEWKEVPAINGTKNGDSMYEANHGSPELINRLQARLMIALNEELWDITVPPSVKGKCLTINELGESL